MTIVATFHPSVDGRTIARSDEVTYVLPTAGNLAVTVTLSEHRRTEHVFEWVLTTDPVCDPGSPTNIVITENIVGCTIIGVGAGTTLIVEAIASGF